MRRSNEKTNDKERLRDVIDNHYTPMVRSMIFDLRNEFKESLKNTKGCCCNNQCQDDATILYKYLCDKSITSMSWDSQNYWKVSDIHEAIKDFFKEK